MTRMERIVRLKQKLDSGYPSNDPEDDGTYDIRILYDVISDLISMAAREEL